MAKQLLDKLNGEGRVKKSLETIKTTC
ncbi:uncharacterized protein G2W53_021896 [Senna tora]|uniref:Uncharacterized protein n=1 Tax=Senna tora TaxID=362788 RepID=A0A834TK94_9FABA|nr:uncharacterized protein G2W53_021896 [Senna tora]